MTEKLKTFERAALAAGFAEDKKATDIVLLDLRGICNFTDAFLIVSGQNRLQLNAISNSIIVGMKEHGELPPQSDGHRSPNWVVLDYGDFIIHIMSEESRQYYNIENLWGDAKPVDLTEFGNVKPG